MNSRCDSPSLNGLRLAGHPRRAYSQPRPLGERSSSAIVLPGYSSSGRESRSTVANIIVSPSIVARAAAVPASQSSSPQLRLALAVSSWPRLPPWSVGRITRVPSTQDQTRLPCGRFVKVSSPKPPEQLRRLLFGRRHSFFSWASACFLIASIFPWNSSAACWRADAAGGPARRAGSSRAISTWISSRKTG